MLNNELTTIFKDLHQNPELSFKEYKTTEYICNQLDEWGVSYHRLKGTGLIAYFDQGHTETIAFRTDIDALPIMEETDFAYKSQNSGVMHACGHDGHMTMLLGIIQKIVQEKLILKKNLLCLFQPAEEVDGGALEVINDEFFKQYQLSAIYGMHVWPELEAGIFSFKAGSQMATNATFEVVIKGNKTHAATPQFGNDAVLGLSAFISGVQTIIAKRTGPFEPLIINVGQIEGGLASNVVIDEISVVGTIRALDNELIEQVKIWITELCQGIGQAYELVLEFNLIETSYPVVNNDKQLAQKVADHLRVTEFKYEPLENPSMASEDFGFYQLTTPGLFVFLGIKDEERGHTSSLHTSTLSFELDVLEQGINLYYELLKIEGLI
ncbi:MAG: M20 metallopeptidase family protein [Mycoplasmatales bacterium]